jgi:hypothetical protein
MWAAIFGAIGGIVLFFRGFRMLQYKRLILNTPVSKIRSASIGLVEVSGNPDGPKTIPAGITGEPCFYYRAQAWQWKESSGNKGSSWQQVCDESVSVPFYLEDSTGSVLINPQGAELDVHRNFTDEISTFSFGKGSIIPASVQKFVALHGLLGGEKIRLEERTIKPGYPLFVFGTLGENPTQTSWSPTPHVSANKISIGGRSLNFKFTVGESSSDTAMNMIQQMLPAGSGERTVSITTTSKTGGPVVVPDRVFDELRRTGIPLPANVVAESSQMGSSAAANASGVALATEAEPKSPGASGPANTGKTFDLHPTVAIGQGERREPFTISSQSQREVVQSLAWKSALYIWCSPVVTVICIYFLLAYWGWL